MEKIKFYYNYPINMDINCMKPVEVYIDQINLLPVPKDSLRIVVLQEPWREPLVPAVQNNIHAYTHLLTYQKELLENNPKARLFHFPNTWIKDYSFPKKEFSVSTVVGGKNFAQLEGHALRHELWKKREQIETPRKFYLSGNAKHAHSFVHYSDASYDGELVLGANKDPLFDSMFHIAIENTSIDNFFTEKLIDCFQTKTVPIYYGCPNIAEYFNTMGIIHVSSVDEIIRICEGLTPKTYIGMTEAIEYNYRMSMKWTNQMEQLKNGIIKILKEEDYI